VKKTLLLVPLIFVAAGLYAQIPDMPFPDYGTGTWLYHLWQDYHEWEQIRPIPETPDDWVLEENAWNYVTFVSAVVLTTQAWNHDDYITISKDATTKEICNMVGLYLDGLGTTTYPDLMKKSAVLLILQALHRIEA
jgi:hypothetical protein